jgi:hypothetical protein
MPVRESECSDGIRWLAFKLAVTGRMTFQNALRIVAGHQYTEEQLQQAEEEMLQLKASVIQGLPEFTT